MSCHLLLKWGMGMETLRWRGDKPGSVNEMESEKRSQSQEIPP